MVLEEPSSTADKQSNRIVVCGKEYDTARYGQTIERTLIEEVGNYVN